MSGLTPTERGRAATHIIIVSDDTERFRSALMLALTQQALVRETRLFLQMDAVSMLIPPVVGTKDAEHKALGMPSLDALVGDVLSADIPVFACQTGLEMAKITSFSFNSKAIDPRINIGGLVSFMTAVETGDHLLTI